MAWLGHNYKVNILLTYFNVLFLKSQLHSPAHVRREVFVAPSPHPEVQLLGPCHSLYKCTFPKSVSGAVILCALIEDVFRSLRPP